MSRRPEFPPGLMEGIAAASGELLARPGQRERIMGPAFYDWLMNTFGLLVNTETRRLLTHRVEGVDLSNPEYGKADVSIYTGDFQEPAAFRVFNPSAGYLIKDSATAHVDEEYPYYPGFPSTGDAREDAENLRLILDMIIAQNKLIEQDFAAKTHVDIIGSGRRSTFVRVITTEPQDWFKMPTLPEVLVESPLVCGIAFKPRAHGSSTLHGTVYPLAAIPQALK